MTRASLFAALACALVLAAGITGSVRVGSAASLNLGSQKFTPYRTCVVTGTPAGTSAVIDAGASEATPTTTLGTATSFDIATKSGANGRAYLKFSLSGCSPSIPSSASVRAATMRIYASAMQPGCQTIDLFRVNSSWTETALTWNNQPFGTAVNNPATGSRTASFDVGSSAGCANSSVGYIAGVDVSSDIAAFVAGSATNNGWMLRNDSESSSPSRTVTFSAKDLGTLAQAPQLIVTYVTTP